MAKVTKGYDLAASDDGGEEYDDETLASIGECLKAMSYAMKAEDWKEAARQFCYAAELHKG
jgi:hypothetical protein